MAAEHEDRPAGAPEEPTETAPREGDDAAERAEEIEQDPARNPPEDDLERIKGG
jgi:hypothetical protein